MNRFEALDDVKQKMIERGADYGDLRANWEKGARRISRIVKRDINVAEYGAAMVGVKLARLQNADCKHIDSWTDIIGYAALAIELIEAENEY